MMWYLLTGVACWFCLSRQFRRAIKHEPGLVPMIIVGVIFTILIIVLWPVFAIMEFMNGLE